MGDAAHHFLHLQPYGVELGQRRSALLQPLLLVDAGPLGQIPWVPEVVCQELERLKALYTGFHYRELARILLCTFGYRIHHRTVQQYWEQSPAAAPSQLDLLTYHSQPDRAAARLRVVQLYYQGWNKRSISLFLHVSRPTVDRWIARFEADHLAGLQDKKPGPKSPRTQWLPVMVAIYQLQKRHPDAGEFRIWSLLARRDLSVRTVGRIMALNKQVYPDIPHVQASRPKLPAQPHPYKASRPHQFWFIDGRKMDFAFNGVKWWSRILLDGYSRTMLAGTVAPVEAGWVALMVLYTACQRYGVPETVISDSGGAFTSTAFEAVCRRLQIHHEPMESSKGDSYKNLMETHFNVQRRLYDYQFSLTKSPTEFAEMHHTCMQTYNTTAHQGLLKEHCDPPIPLAVLGTARGRDYPPAVLLRKFSHALFPRTTNAYGCVTLHRFHFYVEQGIPHTLVSLWLDGDQIRAVVDNVLLAEYECHYSWRTRRVTAIRNGVFYSTRFASLQGTLFPFNPHESVILYRPQGRGRQGRLVHTQQQLLLFEVEH